MSEKDVLDQNFKLGRRWAVIGVVGNLLLTTFKYLAGFLGGSTAMVADATHSASDIIASGVVLISLKFSKRPRDKEHPYGHGGAEIAATILCFFILVVVGIGIFYSGFEKSYDFFVRHQPIAPPSLIAFIAAVSSIITKEWMYRATYKVGKQINSPALIASALDHRSDVFSSIGTVIGIGGALLGAPVLDAISSMVVSVFILRMALEIGKDGLNQIMSASCDSSVISSIQENAARIEGVEAVNCIRAKLQGPYVLVDLTIEVGAQLTVRQGHEIATSVKSALLSSVEHAWDVVVHVEPHEESSCGSPS